LQDFAQPTGEDSHVDRTLLPKILQVKKYGHKSRTKYTHLVDQVFVLPYRILRCVIRRGIV
jgi:hypothetical protein